MSLDIIIQKYYYVQAPETLASLALDSLESGVLSFSLHTFNLEKKYYYYHIDCRFSKTASIVTDLNSCRIQARAGHFARMALFLSTSRTPLSKQFFASMYFSFIFIFLLRARQVSLAIVEKKKQLSKQDQDRQAPESSEAEKYAGMVFPLSASSSEKDK